MLSCVELEDLPALPVLSWSLRLLAEFEELEEPVFVSMPLQWLRLLVDLGVSVALLLDLLELHEALPCQRGADGGPGLARASSRGRCHGVNVALLAG